MDGLHALSRHEGVPRPTKPHGEEDKSDGTNDARKDAIQGESHEIEHGTDQEEQASKAGQDASTHDGDAEQNTTQSKQDACHEQEEKACWWSVSGSQFGAT